MSGIAMNEMLEFRKSLGLTQKRLARLLGVTTRAVQCVEGGEIKLSPKMRLRMSSVGLDKKQIIEQMVAEYRAKLERELLSGPQFVKDAGSVHGVPETAGSSGSEGQIQYYGT